MSVSLSYKEKNRTKELPSNLQISVLTSNDNVTKKPVTAPVENNVVKESNYLRLAPRKGHKLGRLVVDYRVLNNKSISSTAIHKPK